MTWQKLVPFKMNFIVGRALSDRLLTDARLARMEISIKTTCCYCRISTVESTYHLFCRGDFAQDVWKVIYGSFRIPFKDIPLRQLLIN